MKSQLWLKIQSQWKRIVCDLRVSTVLDSLMEKFVISFDEYERISKQETETDKARRLLEILKYKDDQHYDSFLAALVENEYGKIADAIREANIPNTSLETDTKKMRRISDVQEGSATNTTLLYQEDIDHIRADLKSSYQPMLRMPISIFSSDEQVPLDEFCVDIIIKHQIEDVCRTSKTEARLSSYKQIFADGKNKRIILTGRAGSGKSTFCRKLISIWCKGEQCNKLESPDKTENVLQKSPDAISDEQALLQFSLVFYVYAPDLSTEKTLIDYLCHQCKNSEADNPSKSDKLQKVFEEQPEKILIILDGMDEMCDTVPPFLSDLIERRKLYSRITVLMAMRQFRISELGLKTVNDLLLETGGLSRTNALTFVKKIIDLNKNHMSMERLCLSPEEEEEFVTFKNVPLLLLFLTHLWCHEQRLPTRRQDLYKQILDCLIKKCLIKTGNTYTPNIGEQNNITMQKDMFCMLYLDSACMAAYHFLLVEKKGRISEEKLMSQLGDNSELKLKALLDCGILSKIDAFSPLQKYVSIQFLHFSIQEYLASMYLVNNEDAFQTFLASLKALNTIHKYKNLFISICGLDEQKGHMAFVRICEVCDEDPLVIQFRQGRDDDGEIKYSLQGLNLMYKECLKEMNSKEGIVEIPDIVSLEDEWYVTEMSRLRSSISKSLYLCCVTLHSDDALDMSSMINLTFLSLCGVSMSETCSRSLCNSISRCTNMRTLKLEGMTLHDHILDLKSLPNLISLILVDVSMSEKCLCSGISDCTNLERLKLKLIPLDDYVNDISRLTNLTCLTLDTVTMSLNCSKSLCRSISDCTNLRMLQLEGIQLHDGILNLSRLTKVTSLTLKNVIISAECNKEMFGNISSCTQLERLQLAMISVHNGVLDLSRVKDLRHLKVCDLDNADNLYKNV